MSKKKKSQLNKVLKQKQLQQLASGQPTAPLMVTFTPPAAPTQSVRPAAAAPIVLPADDHVGQEIRRTVISLAIVAVLLTGAVIFSHRSGQLTQFGNWLFKALRLS